MTSKYLDFLSCDEKNEYIYLKYSENGFSHTYDMMNRKYSLLKKKKQKIFITIYSLEMFL